jgi:hypothetical protein
MLEERNYEGIKKKSYEEFEDTKGVIRICI